MRTSRRWRATAGGVTSALRHERRRQLWRRRSEEKWLKKAAEESRKQYQRTTIEKGGVINISAKWRGTQLTNR